MNILTKRGHILLEAKELEFVPCSDFFRETRDVFTAQSDTKLSFTDAAIAYVAQKRAGGLVLSFDEEFRKVPGVHMVQPPRKRKRQSPFTPALQLRASFRVLTCYQIEHI